jgi:thiol-disulfide isomerase/thioredoxin
MRILYVNGKNAREFDKENKKHNVFAKYFSPTCPACVAMEDVWDNTCKEVNEKYDTDMIMAQIDPDGMDELKNMKTHSDVAYVPSLLVLKNGKKIKEYEGPKEKDRIIEFLLDNGLIKSKVNNMNGGAKSRKHKTSSKKRKGASKKRKGASKKHKTASRKHKPASKKRKHRKN